MRMKEVPFSTKCSECFLTYLELLRNYRQFERWAQLGFLWAVELNRLRKFFREKVTLPIWYCSLRVIKTYAVSEATSVSAPTSTRACIYNMLWQLTKKAILSGSLVNSLIFTSRSSAVVFRNVEYRFPNWNPANSILEDVSFTWHCWRICPITSSWQSSHHLIRSRWLPALSLFHLCQDSIEWETIIRSIARVSWIYWSTAVTASDVQPRAILFYANIVLIIDDDNASSSLSTPSFLCNRKTKFYELQLRLPSYHHLLRHVQQ